MTTHRESNESELDKDRGDQCLDVLTSSSIRISVVVG